MDRTEPTDEAANAAAAGQVLESEVIERLRRDGYDVTDRQDQWEIRLPALVLRGHIDGIATTADGKKHILEIKTLGQSTWSAYRRYGLDSEHFYAYCAQIACYQEYYRMPILYVVAMRQSTDPPALADVPLDVRVYQEAPVSFSEIRQRLMMAELHARKGTLPHCDRRDYFCHYRYLCDLRDSKPVRDAAKDTAKDAAKDKEMTQDAQSAEEGQSTEVEQWAERYMMAAKQRDAAEAERKQAAAELQRLLGDTKLAHTSRYTVRVVSTVHDSLDLKRLEAQFGSALDPYRVHTSVEYVRVEESRRRRDA
jgi:hypothetical protein